MSLHSLLEAMSCFGARPPEQLTSRVKAVLAQGLLPPAEHSFWKQPNAAAAALQATVAMETERQEAVAHLEAALLRLSRAESEAGAAKEAAAAEARARLAAEARAAARAEELAQLQASLQAAPASPSKQSSQPAPRPAHAPDERSSSVGGFRLPSDHPAALPLLQKDVARLTREVAEWSTRARSAEARLTALTGAASVGPGLGGGSPALARERAAAAEARAAEAEAGLLALKRRYAEASAAAARWQAAAEEARREAAAARAEAAAAKTAGREGAAQASPGKPKPEVDAAALRLELLEERMKVQELRAALAARAAPG